MSEIVLRGGPLAGKPQPTPGARTQVALGLEYGWTFRCGEPAYANGIYLPDGTWQDADRDVVLPYSCSDCIELGEDDD
jgi:hypothetical protein